MTISRGARPQGGIASPAMARAAAVAAEITRTQVRAGVPGPFTRAPKKEDESLFDKGKGNKPMDDDEDDDKTKKGLDGEHVELGAAGSAGPDGGDFKSMPGSLADAFDDNADKGDSPANNSTGAPNTPSGF
jgi:hypothetical protein